MCIDEGSSPATMQLHACFQAACSEVGCCTSLCGPSHLLLGCTCACSESITSMARMHDSLLAAATAARQRVSMRFKVRPMGLQHCCSLLWPRLEVQRRMARRRKLAAALQVGRQYRQMPARKASDRPAQDYHWQADCLPDPLSTSEALQGTNNTVLGLANLSAATGAAGAGSRPCGLLDS